MSNNGMVNQETQANQSSAFSETVRHTRFVSTLKTTFLLLAGVLVLLLVAWPLINPIEKHLKVTFSGVIDGESGMPQMVSPKLQGVDDRNQPYNITADIAVQETEDTVRLSQLKGDILLRDSDDSSVKITSNGGVITLSERMIKLYDNVHLRTESGYTIDTETALIDLKGRIASGDVPVEVKGPLGTLTASGFFLENDKQRLHFVGPVRLVIYPDDDKAGE